MSEKNQGLQCREGGRWKYQAFIQAIWMSGRWHKKLNLLFEFSYSILIKFNYIFFYFKLFIWPPFVKNNNFLGFYTWHPHQGSAMNLLQSLQHLENPPPFYTIWKFCWKMNISRTVWVNACVGTLLLSFKAFW